MTGAGELGIPQLAGSFFIAISTAPPASIEQLADQPRSRSRPMLNFFLSETTSRREESAHG